jgi:hypothetical protein
MFGLLGFPNGSLFREDGGNSSYNEEPHRQTPGSKDHKGSKSVGEELTPTHHRSRSHPIHQQRSNSDSHTRLHTICSDAKCGTNNASRTRASPANGRPFPVGFYTASSLGFCCVGYRPCLLLASTSGSLLSNQAPS